MLARPFLISFSGIDGAGKTTQIEWLSSELNDMGLRVVRLSFWDDIAVWSTLRAGVGGPAAQPTAQSEDSNQRDKSTFVPRNNKHIRKWYLSTARAGFYLLDVVRLRRVLTSERVKNADVVIFDRFVYDQIANIDSESRAVRAYAKFVLNQTPALDLAFVIDASPDAAFARKPEYPLEFVRKNRQRFLDLRELAPQLIVIAEGTPESVKDEILCHVLRSKLVNEMTREREALDYKRPRSTATEFL